MDGRVFAIGDQRTDVFGKGEVKRHGNNGGSEGVAANHQHNGGDATDDRNSWIHGRRRKSGSTLAWPMTLQWVGSPPNAYCKAKPDWMAEPSAEIVGGNAEFL